MDLNLGWLVGGGAVIAMIAGGWRYFKSICSQILSRAIGTTTVSAVAAEAVQMYCWHNFKRSPFGVRNYIGWWMHVRTMNRIQLIAMETVGTSGRLYWYGKVPVLVSQGQQQNHNHGGGADAALSATHSGISITYIRGTLDPDRFIIDCTTYYNRHLGGMDVLDRAGGRHFIRHCFGTDGKPANMRDREEGDAPSLKASNGPTDTRAIAMNRLLQWKVEDIGPTKPQIGKSLDRLALSPEAEELVSDIGRWRDSEKWYRERGIPWKRGVCLTGAPGTGKTSLVRGIGEDLDLPIFVFHLATLYDDEMQRAWSLMLSYVPCIALIEDIDTVFDGRDNKVGHMTFDTLLNCLDGVDRADGLLTVVTTNNIEKLDPAMGAVDTSGRSMRPGRVDQVIRLGPLDQLGREKLCKRILPEYPEVHEELTQNGRGETGAQFEHRCSMAALNRFWNGHVIAQNTETPK